MDERPEIRRQSGREDLFMVLVGGQLAILDLTRSEAAAVAAAFRRAMGGAPPADGSGR